MLYLHDVWVNWFEGEENGYNVPEFHEWHSKDSVELLDQIPLLYVTSELFNYIENSLSEIPKELLELVYGKAYMRKNHERIQMEYCFIVTDGAGILAVDTIGYLIPLRKSRLIPRQEQLIYDMIERTKPIQFIFTPTEKEYHHLSLHPKYMIGLTRREKTLKNLLMMVVDSIISLKEEEKLKYLYSEWDIHNYVNVKDLKFKKFTKLFLDELLNGWTDRHEKILPLAVKGHPHFEKLYEMQFVK